MVREESDNLSLRHIYAHGVYNITKSVSEKSPWDKKVTRAEVTTRTGVARTFAEVAPVIACDEWKWTAVIRRENTLTYLPEEN